MKHWRVAANKAGLNTSEWMRAWLNRVANEGYDGNGSASHQDVSGVPDRKVSGRRTGASKRKSARDSVSTGSRGLPRHRPVGKVSPRRDNVQDDVQPLQTVTRENFAETMALVKPDEVDYWARQLDSLVLPPHTASSHRHTCMCMSCLMWRKTNSIPYGGPVKKGGK